MDGAPRPPGPDAPSRTAAHFARRRECCGAQAPPRADPICEPTGARRRAPCAGCRCAKARRWWTWHARRWSRALARSRPSPSPMRATPGRRRRRWPGLCVLRRAARAAPGHGVELRRADAAQRRADRLPAVGPRRPQRGAVFQHLRQLSRHRGRIHLRALAGGAAPAVRQHLVQHRALPAGLAQRRGRGLRRVVVLRQARLRPARCRVARLARAEAERQRRDPRHRSAA